MLFQDAHSLSNISRAVVYWHEIRTSNFIFILPLLKTSTWEYTRGVVVLVWFFFLNLWKKKKSFTALAVFSNSLSKKFQALCPESGNLGGWESWIYMQYFEIRNFIEFAEIYGLNWKTYHAFYYFQGIPHSLCQQGVGW